MALGSPVGLARFVGMPPSPSLLQSLPFLEGIPIDEVADLLQSSALVVDFSAGDQLSQQDEAAEFVFFILNGSVRIIRRGQSKTGNGNRGGAPANVSVEVINRIVSRGHLKIGRASCRERV